MIHVVFGVDGYISQLAVSMVSMFESNKQNLIQTHIVCINLNANDKDKLYQIALKYNREINFINFDPINLTSLKVFFHLTHATYYRLFIPALIPNLEKVIYLDCDIIVEADLREIWDIDLSGCGNCGVIFDGNDTETRLGIPGGRDMNAGILVMNLNYWRENDITRKCIEWLKKTESIYMDNDAMNVILCGAQKGLEERWNLNPLHFSVYSDESHYPSRILHFAGAIKPWHKAYDFDFQKKYVSYLSLTPWILDYSPAEPWNISQAISVANQHFERGEFVQACGYYNLAFKYRLLKEKLESEEILLTINAGIELQSEESYSEACNKYRLVISFWGFPLKHTCNIYQFPQISD
jgi:lipopolysaccharide biosynthesis glycosyltransferase